MSSKETSGYMDFLMSADILDRVMKDMELLGYVGELENKLLGYLITISRKLDEPLSGIAVSSSGAGKSKLVETLELLTPPEDVIFTSRLTTQALFYMPKDHLKHKLLIVEERAGSELADYAIRILQSKGRLTLAVPVKNQTHFFEVAGPVSILETTTSRKLNSENTSRCFVLHLDESKEQTARVHTYQRLMKTRKGVELKKDIDKLLSFHHNVERLIKKIPVIIPYAEKLSFPTNSPVLRRHNQKLLTLIESITLLYQYQRRRVTNSGVTYIESSINDYEIAFEIFKRLLSQSLAVTHSMSSELLGVISRLNKDLFTRRDIANYCNWPDYRVRDNIEYLEEAGLLQIIRKHRGKETVYRLNKRIDLVHPDKLKERLSSTT